jgi:16S rRNA (adenine1518-N6/adenine1519-N6)-dimethyltransferase
MNDEILGWSDDKEFLHKYNQPHRAVHVFIETYGGGFILQKKGPKSENANMWSSAASGHVEGYETYEEAAIREVKEELGLVVDESEFERVCKVYPCEETANEFVVLFSYLMDMDKESIDPNPEEIAGVRRLPLKELLLSVDSHRDTYSPAFVMLLNMYLELHGMKGDLD